MAQAATASGDSSADVLGRLRAVVFDCDGTLVDTEPLAWATWRELLAPHGIAVTELDVTACTGTSFDHTYAHFARRGRLPSVDVLRAHHDGRLLERLRAGAAAFPDAVEEVGRLRDRRMPLAVASSSPRRRLGVTLGAAGLDGCFDAIVAADDVACGKPHPDLLLVAAARLQLPASACLVVEDAPAGITAGRRAGMVTMAVVRPHNAGQRRALAQAHLVVERLDLRNLATCV